MIRLANLAAGLVILGSAPVAAADFGAPDPAPRGGAVVAQPTAPGWSGYYLGALFGYSWGNGDVSPGPHVEADGVDGGIFAGANYQLDRFVVGAEADLLASAADGKAGGFTLDQGINGSIRGRVGIALDQFLLYGTAGVAATRLEVEQAGDSDSKGLLGLTAGVGGEVLLTPNITARVEYRYTDYEDKTFTVGGGPVSTDLTTQAVRAGLGVKF